MERFHLRIVTLEKDYLSQEGEVLILNIETKGQISLYAHHVDMIASIDVSPLEVKFNGHIRHYALSDGILAINQKDNTIKIIVDSIQSKEEIDLTNTLNEKEEAEKLLSDSSIDEDTKSSIKHRLDKAMNLIHVKTETQDI